MTLLEDANKGRDMITRRPSRRFAQSLSMLCFQIAVVFGSGDMLCAESRTYQVIPAGFGDVNNLAGGTITTDGTIGLLAPENILAMSVDIRLVWHYAQAGMPPQVLDGSTTLDLTNATLSLAGQILATPTGIFVAVPPPSPYDRDPPGLIIAPPDPDIVSYSLSLDGGDAHVIWSSVNLESYGVNNFVSIDSLPAGGVAVRFAESGLIASVIPEPATVTLALAGILLLNLASRSRGR
jgi:hypothetical protein